MRCVVAFIIVKARLLQVSHISQNRSMAQMHWRWRAATKKANGLGL